MPATPAFGRYEFLNASGMNAAFGAVSGALAQVVSGLFLPGLVAPSSLAYSYSGLTVTVSAAVPFQVVGASGQAAYAVGTTPGVVNTAYAVTFSGLVPVSGPAVTAYLSASLTTVGQVPIQVTGPPPGHPDYNPVFVPYTLYTQVVDTVAMTATTGVPDGLQSFEVGRSTLASGATGFVLDPTFQQRAVAPIRWQNFSASGTTDLDGRAGPSRIAYFTASGVAQLPSVATSDGDVFGVVASSGTVVPTASGSDLIYGYQGTVGVNAVAIQTGTAMFIAAVRGRWQVIGFSSNLAALTPVVTAVPGPTYVLNGSGNVAGSTMWRSNGGAAMTDTLPSGTFQTGWSQTVTNVDPSAALVISASGCSLNGAVSGRVILLSQWSTQLWTDGSNFWANTNPITQQTSYNVGAQIGVTF